MLGAYMFVFIYLAFPIFRRPFFLELFWYNIYNKSSYLALSR
jgi:hypothetical protein